MKNTPEYLKDAKTLLSDKGFATSNVWYHGTSSMLANAILKDGLKRSGDKAMKQAAKQTMATIGNNYTESIEPIFLTQSKELAYYWAEQRVYERQVRFNSDETSAIIEISLDDQLNAGVKPDVGAASLLMIKEGEAFMAYVAAVYEGAGIPVPDIDLMKADRLEYLDKLGMAYYDKNIDASALRLVEA
ncbi:MAG: hypothetical protein ACRBBW_06275 [Cellvibrionaceae bacterium]